MEIVEVVIKIPKEYKDYIKGGAGIIPDKIIQYLFNALDNGTVFAKGHQVANRMTVAEIINIIHEQGTENEVFELLTQWMIEDRYNKMKTIGESEATIRAINKIAVQNKNLKQAIDGIISLSGK